MERGQKTDRRTKGQKKCTVIDEEKTEIDDDSNVKVEEETCLLFNFICLSTRKEKLIKD